MNEPLTLNEASGRPDKGLWLQTVGAELKAFDENETKTLVKRPKNENVIKGKWVFKVKQSEGVKID